MCNLSGQIAETTHSLGQAPGYAEQGYAEQGPDVVDGVPQNHELVESTSACTLHCREARVPLSTSAASMHTASYDEFDEPSGASFRRISTSYDWLFNLRPGQHSNDFGVETLDLIGPDPFRWVPMRAHVSESQRCLQVPQSTASGALALTMPKSQSCIATTPEARQTKYQEVVWWSR
jgi:hypothetical protein